MSEFFRLVRTERRFKSRGRQDLDPSKRETFDRMFGTGEESPR